VAFDSVPRRPDPACVATFAGGAVHTVGRTPRELAAVVVGYDGLDVVAEEVRLSFDKPPFSFIHQGAGSRCHSWASAHGTGVIAYCPMQSGILTDSPRASVVTPRPCRCTARRG